MRETIFFLTHDFKPVFRKTILEVDSSLGPSRRAEILMDDRFDLPPDMTLGNLSVVKCFRHPSSFDPLGQAHNFYIDRLATQPDLLESSDYFWVVENDVYFHGNMLSFFDAHASFDTDLLVPEFGHRDRNWCWLRSAKGLSPEPCGVTAVIYRASRRLMRAVLDSIKSGVEAHMEVLLPNICVEQGMAVRQFIPDMVSFCNTFGSPFSQLIESDIAEGTRNYIQRKLYHPVKR